MLELAIENIESGEITPIEALASYELMSFEKEELILMYDIIIDDEMY